MSLCIPNANRNSAILSLVRHDDTSGRFILLNDFDTEFEDAAGVRKRILPSNTSRNDIVSVRFRRSSLDDSPT